MRRIKVGWVVAILAVSLTSFAEEYISTASLFEMGISVRAIGMGGTFIAIADDEAATFYNPAGLASLASPRFSSFFARPFSSYSYSALGGVKRNWGSCFLLLDSGTLAERDLYGNPIGSFRYTSTGLVLGWGHQLTNSFSLGLQLKGYSLAFPTHGFGVALSPAVLFEEGPRSYGILWQNLIATGTRFSDSHNEPWISDIAVGLAWRFDSVTYCIDFTENLITRADISCVRLGLESTKFSPFVLRAGTNRDWSSLGFSVYWEQMRIDFAYLLHYALPNSYLVSLCYQGSKLIPESLMKGFRHLVRALFGQS